MNNSLATLGPAILLALASGCGPVANEAAAPADPGRAPIDHIVVIYQENRSFDNVFELFPGADGLAAARTALPQVDKHGVPYRVVPQPIGDARRLRDQHRVLELSAPSGHEPRRPSGTTADGADHRRPPQRGGGELGLVLRRVARRARGAPARALPVPPPGACLLRRFGDGTPARAAHLKDEQDLLADIAADRLPAVAFVKPLGPDNEHPGYADIESGERHVVDLVERIRQSTAWPRTVIIITYDENGGFWDHVPPPTGDRWGPGARVPTIVVSPHARKGFVDHSTYDTTSILRFIEWRYGLEPLGERDARAPNLLGALDLPGP